MFSLNYFMYELPSVVKSKYSYLFVKEYLLYILVLLFLTLNDYILFSEKLLLFFSSFSFLAFLVVFLGKELSSFISGVYVEIEKEILFFELGILNSYFLFYTFYNLHFYLVSGLVRYFEYLFVLFVYSCFFFEKESAYILTNFFSAYFSYVKENISFLVSKFDLFNRFLFSIRFFLMIFNRFLV